MRLQLAAQRLQHGLLRALAAAARALARLARRAARAAAAATGFALGVLAVVPGAAAARVDGVAAHGGGARHAVQLEVQAARVAHHLAARVAPPDGRRVRAAVAARELHARPRPTRACSSRSR